MKRAFLLALPLALAACGQQADVPDDQARQASGEVLPGSISDAMIPLEQLDSQAPLAPRLGPTAEELDAEQPVVTPVEGVEGAEAAPAPAAPIAQSEE
jgi:hypothetical protein